MSSLGPTRFGSSATWASGASSLAAPRAPGGGRAPPPAPPSIDVLPHHRVPHHEPGPRDQVGPAKKVDRALGVDRRRDRVGELERAGQAIDPGGLLWPHVRAQCQRVLRVDRVERVRVAPDPLDHVDEGARAASGRATRPTGGPATTPGRSTDPRRPRTWKRSARRLSPALAPSSTRRTGSGRSATRWCSAPRSAAPRPTSLVCGGRRSASAISSGWSRTTSSNGPTVAAASPAPAIGPGRTPAPAPAPRARAGAHRRAGGAQARRPASPRRGPGALARSRRQTRRRRPGARAARRRTEPRGRGMPPPAS